MIARVLVVSLLVLNAGAAARGDGGTLAHAEIVGGFKVAVFTAPTSPVAGPIDVSVLVQRESSGETVREGEVTIAARHGDRVVSQKATFADATNQLMRAATMQLTSPGVWTMSVQFVTPNRTEQVSFSLMVTDPPPRWRELIGWIVWPFAVIAVFGIVQRRRDAARGVSKTPGS
jgi:hypothetical protein